MSKYQIYLSKYETCDKWQHHIFSQFQIHCSKFKIICQNTKLIVPNTKPTWPVINGDSTYFHNCKQRIRWMPDTPLLSLSLALSDKWHDKFQPPMLTKMNPLSHSLIMLIRYDWSWHMTKKTRISFYLWAIHSPSPSPFCSWKDKLMKIKIEWKTQKTLTDPAMQLVKLVMSLVCFKIWPCYASEVGDVFWLLWHQGDGVSQSSGHCFCLEVLTLIETIINNDH